MQTIRRIIHMVFVLCLISPAAQAGRPAEQADSAYKAGNYKEAVRLYESALKTEKSAETYYNAGNAYFRLDDYPRAILNYERALRINPSDEDAAYNLDLCRTKITDRFDRYPEMFFITWFKQLAYGHSADAWGNYGLCALLFCLIGFGVYRFGISLRLRKTGFAVGVIFLVATIVLEVFAALQDHKYRNETKAVVMSETPFLPDDGKNAAKRTLHEGATLIVLDEGVDGETQVELPDGKTGWVKEKSLERVNK